MSYNWPEYNNKSRYYFNNTYDEIKERNVDNIETITPQVHYIYREKKEDNVYNNKSTLMYLGMFCIFLEFFIIIVLISIIILFKQSLGGKQLI